jgi:CheY-like chemotaxis protein
MKVTDKNGLGRPGDLDAERSRDELIAMLAHELRNPLAPISSALELIERRADDPQVTARAHEIIGRQVRQLTRLVDDLLDAAHMSRGTLEIRREPVEVGAALATAIETARPLIEARQHRLEVAHCRAALCVDGDASRLAQVFANLLNNSAKYTEPGGVISVSCDRIGASARVRVRDTGIGIAPEVLPRVFELFTQAEPRSRHSMGGLGVGLALARQLVELHGGSIVARSEGAGNGSEFTVQLPLASAERGLAHGDDENAEELLARPRVLVVEDDRDTAEVMATMLRLWGHDVWLAHDGLEAVAQCASCTPQAMIVDINLPKLDGYGVARQVRASGATDVALIALTGYDADSDRERAVRAGYDAFLAKPVTPDLLRVLLKSVAENRRTARRA